MCSTNRDNRGCITAANSLDHPPVIVPDLIQVADIGIHIKANRFISLPVRFQDPGNEWVFQVAVNGKVQFAVFSRGGFE